MYSTSAISFQHPAMEPGRITLVPVKTVMRVFLVESLHHSVPGYLGQDAGRNAGENLSVGFDD